ncbi:hypothetical protein [Streptomyces sp. NPDC091299]|uniref:hypothetical protein n=1 Tax=Streptomyces sp. NPDC091299 TaxID=3155302 RepID=UPI003433959D
MSFNLIPALKGHGKRRAVDKVEELREDNARLLDRQLAADDFFALLMQDRDDLAAALSKAEKRVEILAKELKQAEAAIRLRDQENAQLRQRIAVGVKAEHVIARTQEIPVEEIRRHCTPVPLHQSPLADPAHVPAWAVRT